MCTDRHGSGGFPDEGDAAGVATEGSDILLHPLQGLELIAQPEVGEHLSRLVLQVRVMQPAKHTQPVVHADDDDVLFLGQLPCIVDALLVLVADQETTAFNENHHRKPAVHGEAER